MLSLEVSVTELSIPTGAAQLYCSLSVGGTSVNFVYPSSPMLFEHLNLAEDDSLSFSVVSNSTELGAISLQLTPLLEGNPEGFDTVCYLGKEQHSLQLSIIVKETEECGRCTVLE